MSPRQAGKKNEAWEKYPDGEGKFATVYAASVESAKSPLARPAFCGANLNPSHEHRRQDYDTTLGGDGTQGEGISFSVADKLRIAERLGPVSAADYIEGGFSGLKSARHHVFRRGKTPEVETCAAGGIWIDAAAPGQKANEGRPAPYIDRKGAMPVTTIVGEKPGRCTSRKSCVPRSKKTSR